MKRQGALSSYITAQECDIPVPIVCPTFLVFMFSQSSDFWFSFLTMNDDLYGQVESKSSLWYKKDTIWLKNG